MSVFDFIQIKQTFFKAVLIFFLICEALAVLVSLHKNKINQLAYRYEDYQRTLTNNLAHDLLNGYGFTQKDSENLLEYYNNNFFDKEQLTWDEFKSKFGNNKQSFSWIFSSKGIRNKLEDKTLFKKDN